MNGCGFSFDKIHKHGRVLESLLLFLLLFTPLIPQQETSPTFFIFKMDEALTRLLFRDVPLMFFVFLRLYLDIPGVFQKIHSFRLTDFLLIPVTVGSLALMGTLIQKIYYFCTGSLGPLLRMEGPHNGFEWFILVLSTFSSAYGEECFFRAYLIEWWVSLRDSSEPLEGPTKISFHGPFQRIPPHKGALFFDRWPLQWGPIFVSSLLFALTHLYQGPLGFFQALGAGLILALVYLKTGSIHPPSLAHGIFNLLVYLWIFFS
ncbi:MAG: CPBP family glutamic-type intramembrane protease [Treponemataceae bacterium]|nr:CPBP family glutamic-type intramembrane protease [Treponemataceae bacterium]